MRIEHGGEQWQLVRSAAPSLGFVLVDVPVEVVVGVAPPLDSLPLGCEGHAPGEKSFVEVVIDDRLLGGCVEGAGCTGLRAPAELNIAGMLLFEPSMDVAEVAEFLEGVAGQKVVNDMQHVQVSWLVWACSRSMLRSERLLTCGVGSTVNADSDRFCPSVTG